MRPQQGELYALEDRCAHRQVPLSKGTVTDCRLHCCYHGWSYDASGKCDVPYLGKGKQPNGVRTYPACECDGVIFIWPGHLPAAPQPTSLGAGGDKAYKTRSFGRVVNCHYTFMHENLMDMNHQFLHRRTTGKVSPRYLGKRAGEGWMELDYTFARPNSKQPLGKSLIMGSFRMDTSKPRDRMTIRTEYPHQSCGSGRQATAGLARLAWLHAGRCRTAEKPVVHSAFGAPAQNPRCAGPCVAGVDLVHQSRVRGRPRNRRDEQAAYDAQGADWNQEVFPPIRDLRDLLAKNGRVISAR